MINVSSDDLVLLSYKKIGFFKKNGMSGQLQFRILLQNFIQNFNWPISKSPNSKLSNKFIKTGP